MADKVKEFDSDYLKEKEQNDEKDRNKVNIQYLVFCYSSSF
ncbi:hypothetical protein AABD34_09930 [Staphylococcus saprophyticus]